MFYNPSIYFPCMTSALILTVCKVKTLRPSSESKYAPRKTGKKPSLALLKNLFYMKLESKSHDCYDISRGNGSISLSLQEP